MSKYVVSPSGRLAVKKEEINSVYIYDDPLTTDYSLMLKTIFAFDLLYDHGSDEYVKEVMAKLLEQLEEKE